jgi:WD40 repeat protein/DNA-binding SARP family transcriptional activator
VEIAVLGPLRIDEGGVSLPPRDRVVLAALTVFFGEELCTEGLADALWGDRPPASWGKVVPGCVMRLRRVLGAKAIETTPRGYRLVVGVDEVDARRFERLVKRGHQLLSVGEPDRAVHLFGEALSLWRGRPLMDVEEWGPGQIEANRLDELRLNTEEALLEARLQTGLHWDVMAEAQTRVGEAPLRERRWALLAQAQYRSGRQAEALSSLRRARMILVSELGLDPGPELVGLEEAILRQDPSLVAGPAWAEPSATCPYLGLVPYGIDDADSFFGRESEIAACLRSLAEIGVLAVAGPSGCGKSSLVRAGLAARLQRDGRRVTAVSPGPHPMQVLTGIPASDQPTALVVDQCEEAVLLCEDSDERAEFFAALADRGDHTLLVVAFRADRLGELSAFPGFARLVERNLHLVTPLAEHGLRAVIERPARQAGLLLEPGLVDLLIREVDGEPGALPLLSHALRQTWLRRERRTLTVAGYQDSGGIRGAVAQSAEQLYEGLPAAQRPVLRDLLLRLVTPTPDGEPVRIRVRRRLIAADPARERLIERLVDVRLVTTDDGVVELAHEALARAWPRLRSWLEDDVEGQRILRHLTTSAASWEAMGRPDAELYRGARLAQALGWRDAAHPDLTHLERDFLDASAAREAADLRAAQTQLRHQRRTVRRLRRMVTGVAVLAALATISSLVALDQRERANQRSTIAEARRVSARALVEPAYDRALLLAVEAVHLWNSPETRANLLTTTQRNPLAAGVIRGGGLPDLRDLDISPDGEQAVVLDDNDTLTLYNLADRAPVASLDGDPFITALRFSPDGTHLAISTPNNSCCIALFNARDLGRIDVTYQGLGLPASDIAYSPRGDLIAAITPLLPFLPSGEISKDVPPPPPKVPNIGVWRVSHPDEPMIRLSMATLGGDPTEPSGTPVGDWIGFSPDGARLYASSAGQAVAFDIATGRQLRAFDGAGALALSPDGATIVTATRGTDARLVDTATGRQRAKLIGHAAPITDAAFSADGTLLATVSDDGTALVWDVATGQRRHRLQGHTGSVHAVAFGAGHQLYTSGSDGVTIQWDLDRSRGPVRQLVPPRRPHQMQGMPLLSPSADSVLILPSASSLLKLSPSAVSARRGFILPPAAGAIGLLNVSNGVLTRLSARGHPVLWAAYRPDGRRIATVGLDGSVQLWDVKTAKMIADRPGRRPRAVSGFPPLNPQDLGAIAFTPDGTRIVVADPAGRVTELDARTLEPTGRSVVDLPIAPLDIQATRGGMVAVTSAWVDVREGLDVVFADLDDGRILRRLHTPGWHLRATNFSPDGRLYAYGGIDGRVGVIDVATGKVIEGSRDPVHAGPVSRVTFSPDSRTLASLGIDGQVTLLDATNAAPFTRVQLGDATLQATAGYLPDGHTLILAYDDGSVISFDTDPAAWERHACEVAGRNLSIDEWRDAFGDRPYRQTCAQP